MLDYKIGQLEKLGTWVIEDLLKGHNTIPCSAMLKEKHGPDGKITSYQVHIVTGGHRQVEGVNHSKTFSSTAKMPLWAEAGRLWVVPGNEPGPHKGSWIHLFH